MSDKGKLRGPDGTSIENSDWCRKAGASAAAETAGGRALANGRIGGWQARFMSLAAIAIIGIGGEPTGHGLGETPLQAATLAVVAFSIVKRHRVGVDMKIKNPNAIVSPTLVGDSCTIVHFRGRGRYGPGL